MQSEVIRGAKVLLRRKRFSDAANDYRWRVDEELCRLDATVPLQVSFDEYLRQYHFELEHPLPWSRWFAIDTLDDKHIGNCMYYDIDYINGEAEVGILIGEREYWGKSYGTDAVTALVAYIFASTPLRRVYLHTLEWNQRARSSFQKCGFEAMRKVRRNGQVFIYMELPKRRWLKLREQQGKELTSSPPSPS